MVTYSPTYFRKFSTQDDELKLQCLFDSSEGGQLKTLAQNVE